MNVFVQLHDVCSQIAQSYALASHPCVSQTIDISAREYTLVQEDKRERHTHRDVPQEYPSVTSSHKQALTNTAVKTTHTELVGGGAINITSYTYITHTHILSNAKWMR